MPVLCGLIVFELALAIAGGVYAFKQFKTDSAVRWNALMAWLGKNDRQLQGFQKDFNNKFNSELVSKIDAVLRYGRNTEKLTLGKDGKLHKVNREY